MRFGREAAEDVKMRLQRVLHGNPVGGTAEEDTAEGGTGHTPPVAVPGEEESRQFAAGKETEQGDKGWWSEGGIGPVGIDPAGDTVRQADQ